MTEETGAIMGGLFVLMAVDLRRKAARERAWSYRETEWPRYRAEYARAARTMEGRAREIEALLATFKGPIP